MQKVNFINKALYTFTVVGLSLSGCKQVDKADFTAPLFDNMGDYAINISTQSEYSEKFFNQGLNLAYAFNHAEAERSYKEAIRLDSGNAMAYWGAAYVLGANYNAAMDEANKLKAKALIEQAVDVIENASDWEKALINATAIRYNYLPGKEQKVMDVEYSNAMRKVSRDFPENDDISVLFAESLMNLHPWDLYTKKGIAKPWTKEIEDILELVLARNPDHPGANHMYIHAVEASSTPERGLKVAERLPALVPGAGHLVHMPSHIYIRTGDYHKGSEVNELATKVDSLYIVNCNAQGAYPLAYFPHNIHFLAATAALEGRGETAINAAFRTAFHTDTTVMIEPGMQTLQHYLMIPYYVMVKFGQWDKILSIDNPAADLLYPTAVWHYARGMAFTGKNEWEKAAIELEKVKEISQNPELSAVTIWDINSADQLIKIAKNVLEAEILYKNGQLKEAIALLYQAVEIEDQLNYNEPPDWFFSVRHTLGAVLMADGQFEKAQQVYEEDLFYFPKNGWALNGFYSSLMNQNKLMEALDVMQKFETAWQYADIELEGSLVKDKVYGNIQENPSLANAITSSSQSIPLCRKKNTELIFEGE